MNWQLEVKLSSLTILGHCLLGRRDSRSGFMRTVVHTWLHCNRFKSLVERIRIDLWLVDMQHIICIISEGLHVWWLSYLKGFMSESSCLVATMFEGLQVWCLHVWWIPYLKSWCFYWWIPILKEWCLHVWRASRLVDTRKEVFMLESWLEKWLLWCRL